MIRGSYGIECKAICFVVVDLTFVMDEQILAPVAYELLPPQEKAGINIPVTRQSMFVLG